MELILQHICAENKDVKLKNKESKKMSSEYVNVNKDIKMKIQALIILFIVFCAVITMGYVIGK